MNFVQVQLFDPKVYDMITAPFWINLDHVSSVCYYDPEIHAPRLWDENTGTGVPHVPEGAIGTVIVYFNNYNHHLDLASSKKVFLVMNHD